MSRQRILRYNLEQLHIARKPEAIAFALPPESKATQWPSNRWRVLLLACLAALLLQGMLLLSLALGAPLAVIGDTGVAQAAPLADEQSATSDDFTVRYAVVVTRPLETVGRWVIGEFEYTVTAESEVDEGLEAGDCVETKSEASAPTVALKIVKQEMSKCNDGSGDTYLRQTGIVNSRPEGKIGAWVISDTEYSVAESTVVEGDLGIGKCVEVKVLASAPHDAVKIQAVSASNCGDDSGQGGEGDGEDSSRREWEGTIDSFPPLLVGTWVVIVGESKKLTFTTNLATRFDPNLPISYAVGRWVEVKGTRQPDGTFVAERVRVDDYEMGEIVVRLESAAISNTIANKYGLVLTSTLLSRANIYLYETTNEDEQQLVENISHEDGVIWAEVNFVNGVPEEDGYKTWGWGGISEPDEYTNQSAYQQIRWSPASRLYDGTGVVVAVLDTGVYTPHEQFEGRLQLPSLDVIDDDTDPSEEGPGLAWGHGTHVAGIVAAMAPAARILPVRVLDENGRGNTFLLAYAIEWVAQQPGVQVINLSLGTEFDSKILRDVIESVVEQGILVVAAAGNNGTDQVQYPAGYPGVVGVTAVDGDLHKATFANYGSGWVDIAAPGVGIMSTMINAEGAGYATWSGTSMSTAFVSGAAVLVAEKWDAQVATLGGMVDQLLNTGLVVDALNPLFAGKIGRLLDVSAALDVKPSLLFMPQTVK